MAVLQLHSGLFLSGRATALATIIALHVLVVYGLSSGLAGRLINVVAPPIQTKLIEEIKPIEEPPPPPVPNLQDPVIEITQPRIVVKIPVETHEVAVSPVVAAASPASISLPVAAPTPVSAPPRAPRSIVHAGVGRNFPNPNDFYPPASLRLDEQGAVGVKACVGPNGKLVEPPTVARSSGFPLLDQAAIALARVGRYLAASVDGVPVKECVVLPIRFQMNR